MNIKSAVRLAAAIAIAAGALGAQELSDADIQKAIDSGRKSTVKAIWSSIEKRQTVRINRSGFGDTVGKKAVFLTDSDTIAMAAADATRRHQVLSSATVRQWPNLGTVHVMLSAEASGIYAMNLPKWQAPAVHMTLTVDGVEIQPSEEGATERTETQILPTEHGIVTNQGGLTSYTPLYQTAIYDVARSNTWFAFAVPDGAGPIRVTVISADGHEKSKEFDGAILKGQPR